MSLASCLMNSKGEIFASILRDFRNCYIFLHNTRDSATAAKIMNEGFIFENQLDRSSDIINPDDLVEIDYFLLQRKDYGQYTIVIAIPETTYDNYSALSVANEVCIEEVISISEPGYSENDEPVYTIAPGHILGCFNSVTNEFTMNSHWDPLFNNCISGSGNFRL